MTSNRFWYRRCRKGAVTGPFSELEIRSYLNGLEYQPAEYLRLGGSDWRRAQEVKALFDSLILNGFFYLSENQSIGPFTKQRLSELHSEGTISNNTLVRQGLTEEWYEFCTVHGPTAQTHQASLLQAKTNGIEYGHSTPSTPAEKITYPAKSLAEQVIPYTIDLSLPVPFNRKRSKRFRRKTKLQFLTASIVLAIVGGVSTLIIFSTDLQFGKRLQGSNYYQSSHGATNSSFNIQVSLSDSCITIEGNSLDALRNAIQATPPLIDLVNCQDVGFANGVPVDFKNFTPTSLSLENIGFKETNDPVAMLIERDEVLWIIYRPNCDFQLNRAEMRISECHISNGRGSQKYLDKTYLYTSTCSVWDNNTRLITIVHLDGNGVEQFDRVQLSLHPEKKLYLALLESPTGQYRKLFYCYQSPDDNPSEDLAKMLNFLRRTRIQYTRDTKAIPQN